MLFHLCIIASFSCLKTAPIANSILKYARSLKTSKYNLPSIWEKYLGKKDQSFLDWLKHGHRKKMPQTVQIGKIISFRQTYTLSISIKLLLGNISQFSTKASVCKSHISSLWKWIIPLWILENRCLCENYLLR